MSTRTCDLLVVGAGPAGLSAALNAGSEGLSVCLVDAQSKFGGQAGTSTRIENYPGFPGGITGPELTTRMLRQVDGFGVEMMAPHRIEKMWCDGDSVVTEDDDEMTFTSRAVILTFGVQYRTLTAKGVVPFLDRGVHYGSPSMRINYEGSEMFVVGGANSAGQAALHLAKQGHNVHILIRGDSIEKGMSSYLVERINDASNITVYLNTEVEEVAGDDLMRTVVLKVAGVAKTMPADQMFVLIGAKPKTKWVPAATDAKGFVLAGGDLCTQKREEFYAANGRMPLAHETSIPGVFVAGDLRAGTFKRVAGAVGDGATTVGDIHQFLALSL